MGRNCAMTGGPKRPNFIDCATTTSTTSRPTTARTTTTLSPTWAADELGDVVDVAIAAGNFKTLVGLLTELKLVDALKGMTAQTIFAPSDEAFAKLPEGTLDGLTTEQKTAIVLRHVIANLTVPAADVKTGPVVTLGGEMIDLIKTDAGGVQISYMGTVVNVVTADVMASNGVIHVIDEVILPAPLGDVVEEAVANGNFKTLVGLLTELNLVDALKGMTAQTIFAPSDAAFAKLPEGTLDGLTPEQKLAIVSRHVVANATVLAADVTTGSVKTLGGEMIDLIKTDAGILISYKNNLINIALADVMASNGVIHVIDGVILPGEPTTTTPQPIITSIASMPQSMWALLMVMVSLMSLII